MYEIESFIKWALTHVKKESLPSGASLVLSEEDCGKEPWEYLYGSIRVETTDQTLNRYFDNYYSKQMTRSQYDQITEFWSRTGYATDCQGLLDAYLTYQLGDSTDINADGNYRLWCSEKGLMSEILRPYRIGEAVFSANSNGRMNHVGWICGFDGSEPLVVEARSIRYGVIVSKLSERNFTHRGLMTKKFDYNGNAESPVILKYKTPMIQGEAIKALQTALNGLGYTDGSGNPLSEDGKCGKRTMEAVTAFANNQASECVAHSVQPFFIFDSTNGEYEMRVQIRSK